MPYGRQRYCMLTLGIFLIRKVLSLKTQSNKGRESKMRVFIAVLFTVCFGQMAFAGTNYVCTQAGMERKIEVVYLAEGKVPCEVRYTKFGDTQVLWSAQAEEGYCEARAAEFVEKQRGWGWECLESGAEMSDPEMGKLEMGEPSAPLAPEEQGLE